MTQCKPLLLLFLATVPLQFCLIGMKLFDVLAYSWWLISLPSIVAGAFALAVFIGLWAAGFIERGTYGA